MNDFLSCWFKAVALHSSRNGVKVHSYISTRVYVHLDLAPFVPKTNDQAIALSKFPDCLEEINICIRHI